MHHYLQARNGEHIVSPTTYAKCPNCIQNPISGKVAKMGDVLTLRIDDGL